MLEGESPGPLLALTVALLLPALVAGCAGPDDSDVNRSAQEQAARNCNASSGSTLRTSGVEMACQNVSVGGKMQEDFQCENPDQSAIRVATNMTAGTLTVRALDAGQETLFERTYEQRGPFNETERIDSGRAGSWVLEAVRGEDFEGSFGAQIACAK